MQMTVTRETWGAENQKWLGSAHATSHAQTVTLDGKAFAAFADKGTIPSGIPLTAGDDGKFKPVSQAGDTLAGFLFTSQSFNGKSDVIAPMVDHGRIRVEFLPEQAFDIATLSAPNPAFVLVKKKEEA